jgi:hypothetical protein
MVPVYGATSFLGILFFSYALYFSILQGVYQVVAIISFYDLLRYAIAPTLREQKVFFEHLEHRNWGRPIRWLQMCTGGAEKGLLRRPTKGSTWFNVRYAIQRDD